MKHRINRLFFIWQSAEEEKWLNNMAAKGLALTGVWLFRYEFEDSEPGEWVYRMELLRHTPEHPESRKHIAFMEETGAEMVTRCKNWVYYRKRRSEGEFTLYSEHSDLLRQLTYVQVMLMILAAVLLLDIFVQSYMICRYHSMMNAGTLLVIVPLLIWLVYGLVQVLRRKKMLRKEQQMFEHT